MKTERVQNLTSTFEAHAPQTEGGIECWLARDLEHTIGGAKPGGVVLKTISAHAPPFGKMCDLLGRSRAVVSAVSPGRSDGIWV